MDLKECALQIIEEVKKAANPKQYIKESVRFDQSKREIRIEDKVFTARGHLYVVAVGKAAPLMTEGLLEVLGSAVEKGIMVIPHGYEFATPDFTVFNTGHPVPDAEGEVAAKTVLDFLEHTNPDDLIVFLLSGGGSALLPLPRDGITLQDKMTTTKQLLACGARIQEINAVRRHLSKVKGGNLAQRTKGTLITLVLSDVLGDPLDSIASGPTVADPTTFDDVARIFTKFDLCGKLPANVEELVKRGQQGMEEDTPKAVPARHYVKVIASNKTAVAAGVQKARELGFNTVLLTTFLEGEAREVAHVLSAVAREVRQSGNPAREPAAIFAGGETTVTLKGTGLGGRNQEMALALALDLQDMPGILGATYATDGRDGPTDAAGAIVTGATVQRAREAKLDASVFLQNDDSYHFFDQLGDLIRVPPTSTNVNDVAIVLIE
ncbi:MAG: glycerate kinase type-2 family protein [Candidatus Cryosericum sp.]